MEYKIPEYTPPEKHYLDLLDWPPGPIDTRQLKVLTKEQIQMYLTKHFKMYEVRDGAGYTVCCRSKNGLVYGHDDACKYNPYRPQFNMCCGNICHQVNCKHRPSESSMFEE
jgi:hypothetical protein